MEFYHKFLDKVHVSDMVRIGIKDKRGAVTKFSGQVTYIDLAELKVVLDWDGIRVIAPLEMLSEFMIIGKVLQ